MVVGPKTCSANRPAASSIEKRAARSFGGSHSPAASFEGSALPPHGRCTPATLSADLKGPPYGSNDPLRTASAAEVPAARPHGGGFLFHAHVEPAPFARAGGFDGEHVLLAKFGDQIDCGRGRLVERGGKVQLSARPVRQVAQVCRLL